MNLCDTTKYLKISLGNVDSAKPELAKVLWNTKHNFCWKETKYGTWRKFCNLEVALSQTTIYKYLKTAELINKFNYSYLFVFHIVSSIGWARFQLGITKIESYLPVDKFIQKFKHLNLNEKVVFEESDSELIPFSFSLPAHSAELLTNELVVRGMRINKHNRTNASAAMIKLLRDIQKSEV